jgi:hypothetical protein
MLIINIRNNGDILVPVSMLHVAEQKLFNECMYHAHALVYYCGKDKEAAG